MLFKPGRCGPHYMHTLYSTGQIEHLPAMVRQVRPQCYLSLAPALVQFNHCFVRVCCAFCSQFNEHLSYLHKLTLRLDFRSINFRSSFNYDSLCTCGSRTIIERYTCGHYNVHWALGQEWRWPFAIENL